MCEYIYNIHIKLTMCEYFEIIAYIITCIFELNSILLSLSFMIEILEISNQFMKLLLSSKL